MGLIESGEAHISKSGKSLLVHFDDHVSNYPKILCLNRAVLQKVLDDKRYAVKVMLITGDRRPRPAASDPDL